MDDFRGLILHGSERTLQVDLRTAASLALDR